MASGVRITDGQWDFSGGIDSGRVTTIASELAPHGLQRNQLAWLTNATVRGGGILQRTGWRFRARVHNGNALFQGGFLYEPDFADPYLVVSIAGRIYQIRVDTDYSVVDITGASPNPALERQSFFVQAEKFLVIQAGDNATLPLIWDNATMRRSNGIGGVPPNEIPAATAMDYYMGRLWYAQGRTYSAGDIVGGESGTSANDFRDAVLRVTENPLALGGDGFTVPTNAGNIRALKHSANLDTALGQGNLYVFTRKVIYALTVPVTRVEWSQSKEPLQRVVQITNGTYGDRCIAQINGDLFYQSTDGIRSLLLAIRYFQQWGNTPISENENRVLQFNDRSLMRFASAIEFDNRLWQTALPVDTVNGVASQAIIPLDFDLISSLQEKLPPAWEGMYEGLDVLQMFSGDFGGRERAFAVISSRVDDSIQVWEFTDAERFENGDNRVNWFIETPAYIFGKEFELKTLNGGEIWFDKLFGTVQVLVEYRVDADPCWIFWHETTICAARSTCEDVHNPICYPEQGFREGYKWPITLPEPPLNPCQEMNSRPSNIGYQFQVKITLKGWCRIRGILVHAIPVDKAPYDGLTC